MTGLSSSFRMISLLQFKLLLPAHRFGCRREFGFSAIVERLRASFVGNRPKQSRRKRSNDPNFSNISRFAGQDAHFYSVLWVRVDFCSNQAFRAVFFLYSHLDQRPKQSRTVQLLPR